MMLVATWMSFYIQPCAPHKFIHVVHSRHEMSQLLRACSKDSIPAVLLHVAMLQHICNGAHDVQTGSSHSIPRDGGHDVPLWQTDPAPTPRDAQEPQNLDPPHESRPHWGAGWGWEWQMAASLQLRGYPTPVATEAMHHACIRSSQGSYGA